MLDGAFSDYNNSGGNSITTATTTPKDLLASIIEETWLTNNNGVVESPQPQLAEVIADFGRDTAMELPCLRVSQLSLPPSAEDDFVTTMKQEEEEEEFAGVASPDSGIGACYDLDSNSALLCSAEDPILGLPFDMDLFEASTSVAGNGVVVTDDNYSLEVEEEGEGADAAVMMTSVGEDRESDMLMPDSFMADGSSSTAGDPMVVVSEQVIKEAPVIICDDSVPVQMEVVAAAPLMVAAAVEEESPALARLGAGRGVKFSKAVHSYAVRPPLKRRKKGAAAHTRGPAAKPVVRARPSCVVVQPPAVTTDPLQNVEMVYSRGAAGGGGASRRRKLYELGPLENPDEERCRLNALNAKKNREKKKRQLAEAAQEIDRLRNENSLLRTEADEVRDQLEQARLELAQLRAQLGKAADGGSSAVDDREE